MDQLERAFQQAFRREAEAISRETASLFRKLMSPVLGPVEEYVANLEARLTQAREHGDPAEVAALEEELQAARKILDIITQPW